VQPCCAVVGIFALVVGPSMKMDPEEMKQMQEEIKDTPLSFLMGKSATQPSVQPALATASAKRAVGAPAPGTPAMRKKR
jgi:hypothetical protein